MAGARTQGVGRGVRWDAFRSIASLLVEAGRAAGEGYSNLGAGIGQGAAALGAKMENRRRDALERQEREGLRAEARAERESERSYRRERDSVLDSRWLAEQDQEAVDRQVAAANAMRDDQRADAGLALEQGREDRVAAEGRVSLLSGILARTQSVQESALGLDPEDPAAPQAMQAAEQARSIQARALGGLNDAMARLGVAEVPQPGVSSRVERPAPAAGGDRARKMADAEIGAIGVPTKRVGLGGATVPVPQPGEALDVKVRALLERAQAMRSDPAAKKNPLLAKDAERAARLVENFAAQLAAGNKAAMGRQKKAAAQEAQARATVAAAQAANRFAETAKTVPGATPDMIRAFASRVEAGEDPAKVHDDLMAVVQEARQREPKAGEAADPAAEARLTKAKQLLGALEGELSLSEKDAATQGAFGFTWTNLKDVPSDVLEEALRFGVDKGSSISGATLQRVQRELSGRGGKVERWERGPDGRLRKAGG